MSVNQPKLCPSASWNLSAATFAPRSTVRTPYYDVFVDTNNTVYLTGIAGNLIEVWPEKSNVPTQNMIGLSNRTSSLFVTLNGDIYLDYGSTHNRVEEWKSHPNTIAPAMFVADSCTGLFVDIYDSLYCSVATVHQIFKRSLNADVNSTRVIAGLGINGSTSDMLDHRWGLFVDSRLDLYVADCGNNRVQRFATEQSNAVTVAGQGASLIRSLSSVQPMSFSMPMDICSSPSSGTIVLLDLDLMDFVASLGVRVAGDPLPINSVARIRSVLIAMETCLLPIRAIDDFRNSTFSLIRVVSVTFYLSAIIDGSSLLDQTTTEEPQTSESTFSNCNALIVNLLPSSSSLSSPLQYRGNEDFFISSTIHSACANQSFPLQTEWTFFRFPSIPVSVDPVIKRTFSELYVPAQILPVGLYQLTLTVTFLGSFSASTYVQIIPSGIAVHLFPLSTSLITHGYNQDLILDPGRFSINLDGVPFNASVSVFNHADDHSSVYVLLIGLDLSVLLPCLRSMGFPDHSWSTRVDG